MKKIVNGEAIELEGAALTAEEARIQAEIDAVEAVSYIEDRLSAYGKIADQLDMIYRDIVNETLDQTGEFYAHIHDVKETYPKPE